LSSPPFTILICSLLPCTGEVNITRGIAASSLIQLVSSNASLSYPSIIASAAPSQTLFFQLYKNANDELAEKRVREVEALGYKAIWLTVDAIVAGNRERDIKVFWNLQDKEKEDAQARTPPSKNIEEAEKLKEPDVNMSGTAGAFVANDDKDMTWRKVRHSILFVSSLLI
jgi:L-lactate dehydrogenase (cytochrome)